MSVEQNESFVADTLLLLHHAITRGLAVSQERGAAFAQHPPASAELRDGFADYVTALTSVINAHHSGEDEVVYPALRPLIPGAPYDRLMADHRDIQDLMNTVRDANTLFAGPGRAADSRQALAEMLPALEGLSAIWHEHIPIEEFHFSAGAVNAVLTMDEQLLLGTQWAAHSQSVATPSYLAMPFVLYNLPSSERAEMGRRLPPRVVDELVPVAWASHWRAMRPFLLAD